MRLRLTALLLASSLFAAPAMAHFEEGQVWVIDYNNSRLYRVNVDNWLTFTSLTAVDGLSNPGAIGFSQHGHMLIANHGDDTVLEVEAELDVTTILTAADGINNPFGGNGLVLGPGHGDVFLSNFGTNEILKFNEELTSSTVFADSLDGIVRPGAMAFLSDGDMLVGNRGASDGEILHIDEVGNAQIWANIAGEVVASIAVRNNGDVYVLTLTGDIHRFLGGHPSSSVLLGTYGPSGPVNGSIAFDPDHNDLYHVNAGNNEFRVIDPDTGTSSVPAMLPGQGSAMIVLGGHYAPGTWYEFGDPLAGTGGVAPTLEGHEEPRIGEPAELHINDFVGGTQIYLFFSAGMVETPLFGGEFHMDLSAPTIVVDFPSGGTPGIAGTGDVDIAFTLPLMPSIVYSKFYLQALAIDPAAPAGVSMTQCLTMYVGD
jgi:hypothetical protein